MNERTVEEQALMDEVETTGKARVAAERELVVAQVKLDEVQREVLKARKTFKRAKNEWQGARTRLHNFRVERAKAARTEQSVESSEQKVEV